LRPDALLAAFAEDQTCAPGLRPAPQDPRRNAKMCNSRYSTRRHPTHRPWLLRELAVLYQSFGLVRHPHTPMQPTHFTYYWEVLDSPHKSPFLQGSTDFGDVAKCYLIDPYRGRRAFLINNEFVQKGEISFHAYACAVMDSNLANQVHAVAHGGKVNDGFHDLLVFLKRNRWDFSLQFYYIEHYCKSRSSADFAHNARARTTALLHLFSMDREMFLERGLIRPYVPAVEHYLQKHNASTLEEASAKVVNEFMCSYQKNQMREIVAATEIALMRMVLLEKFELRNVSPEAKVDAFRTFLVRDMEILLAEEAHFALHYFHGKAGTLLGIQSNTPVERALAIVSSTAWDMFLLRFYYQFFSEDPKELRVVYMATQEKTLASIAKLYSVAALYGDDRGRVFPVVGYDTSALPAGVLLSDSMPRAPLTTPRRVPVGLREALIKEFRRVLPA
jgi:hypothetical protein